MLALPSPPLPPLLSDAWWGARRRAGGAFVCKIFDNFTAFTVELLYIMSLHFDRFTIIKPLTSRPANSERSARGGREGEGRRGGAQEVGGGKVVGREGGGDGGTVRSGIH